MKNNQLKSLIKTERRLISEDGQALVEFSLWLPLISFLLIAVFHLFMTEWKRANCAYRTFEATHSKMIGQMRKSSMKEVIVREEKDRWIGEGRSGNLIFERVELPKLESAHW